MYSQGNWGDMGMMGNFAGGGYMFWILILLIGFIAYIFIKNMKKDNNNDFDSQRNSAFETLKKRFANSEISEGEFLSKKEILNSN